MEREYNIEDIIRFINSGPIFILKIQAWTLNTNTRMVKLLFLPAKMSILKPEQMTDIFDDIQGKNVSIILNIYFIM